jgi:PKD repeat protein
MAVDFVGVPTSGEPPLSVDFTDATVPTPLTWSWTFGDGGVDLVNQNPTYIYVGEGTFDVTLSVTYPNYFVNMDTAGLSGDVATGIIYTPSHSAVGGHTYLLGYQWNNYQQSLLDPCTINSSAVCVDASQSYLYYQSDSSSPSPIYRIGKDGSGQVTIYNVLGPGPDVSGWHRGISWDPVNDRFICAGTQWLNPTVYGGNLYAVSSAGVLQSTWSVFPPIGGFLWGPTVQTTAVLSDGRVAVYTVGGFGYSARILRLYSAWNGILLSTNTLTSEVRTWATPDSDNNCVYFTRTTKIDKWDLATNTITSFTPSPAHNIQQGVYIPVSVATYGGWIYYKAGAGSAYRYNWNTATEEAWDGTSTPSSSTTKLAYIDIDIILPEIDLSLASLSPSCFIGEDATSETFDISNSGGGTLTYTISDNQTWLTCTPSSGTCAVEIDTITVNYSTEDLDVGTYTATITIEDPEATNTPQTISVSLGVTPPTTEMTMRHLKWFYRRPKNSYLGWR